MRCLLAIPETGTRLLCYGAAVAIPLVVLSVSHYFGVLVWLVAIGLVLAGEDRPVARLLNNRPMLLLGTWSYSIYLLHEIVIHATLFLLPDLGGGRGAPRLVWLSAISVPTTLLFSALVYQWIEKPGMALGRHGFSRRPATPTPPSTHA